MKIVETPPKTGEEFIVAWFDDGEARSDAFRFNLELDSWELIRSGCAIWAYSNEQIEKFTKNKLVIIEE